MNPGDRVRAARELLSPKLSTKELDRLAGFTEGLVWSIEKNGGEKAEAKNLDAIARVLGVSMDWLVRGEGEPPTASSIAAAVDAARVKPVEAAS
jgi:transcriptional regulator with XRE-family HTH domain